MRLVEDPHAASWLDTLEGEARDFEWDTGNRTKLKKHEVEEEDVESMFRSPIIFAGRIIEPAHDEPRWLVLGKSVRGRKLALIPSGAASGSGRSVVGLVYEEAIRAEGKGARS